MPLELAFEGGLGKMLRAWDWHAHADAASLLLSTLPIWLPLLALALLTLAGSAWRVARPRSGHLAAFVGPWLLRRLARVLRRALRRRRLASATAPTGAVRRSLASSVDLQASSGLDTRFNSGGVPGVVSQEAFGAFRGLVHGMPATTPSSEWQRMLDKETSVMTYSAWRKNLPSGSAEYLSVTVFEGATPTELLEFFNDDAHRMSWDDMLVGYEVLEVDPRTGAEAVRWVRRFPLMCCPRDYVFTRRSWVDGDDFFTICSACNYAPCPPRPGCRRVDDFYSAWRMRAVPGRGGGVATEVVLLHREDQGIQHDLARIAIRRGMWGCVQRMEKGLCTFIKRRRERLRTTRRASTGSAPLTPKRAAAGALPHGGEREARSRGLLSVVLRSGLMALGGLTLAHHGAKAAGGARALVVAHARHKHHAPHRHKAS